MAVAAILIGGGFSISSCGTEYTWIAICYIISRYSLVGNALYRMARKTGVELNSAVGKINSVSQSLFCQYLVLILKTQGTYI